MLPKVLLGVIASTLLALILLGSWHALSKESAESLAQQALTAPDDEARLQAALQLSLQGPDGVIAMRRVLAESDLPAARAAAIDGLAAQRDWESMPTFIELLEDESPTVRGRAAVAVSTLFGKRFDFNPQAPAEQRARFILVIREYWRQHNNVIDDSSS